VIRSWATQQALYARLNADTTLMGMVTAIRDQPDQNAIFPYITLGEGTGAPDDLLDVTGAQMTQTLHVWDKSTSMMRIKQVMDRMSVVLHGQKFAMAGAQMVTCLVEFTEVIREQDDIRHGVLRVRFLTFG
jgi:hypothetical protein